MTPQPEFFSGNMRDYTWSHLGPVSVRRPVLRRLAGRRSGLWWSSGLHLLLLLWLFQFAPSWQAPTKPDVLPIEVAFVEDTTRQGSNPAPPVPKVKPAVEAPAKAQVQAVRVRPVRAQALKREAVRTQNPVRQVARVSRQKSFTEQKQADLQTLLQARLHATQAQEDAQLQALKERMRAGARDGEVKPAGAQPVSETAIGGSGLSGALAARESLRRISPAYPPEAQMSGEEGDVRVRLWVSAAGTVLRAEVVRSSGRVYFDTAALQAVRQWRFTPLPGAGEQWGELTMTFRLR